MALTGNSMVERYVDQELRALPVKEGAHLYKGALVGLSGGYARPLTSGDPFGGVVYEEGDNTDGLDGELTVRVYTLGDFVQNLAGASRANNFKPVFATDDATLTTTPGGTFVGYQLEVPATNKIILRIQATPVPLAGGTLAGTLVSAGIQHKVVTKASAANVTIAAADLGGAIVVTGTTAGNLNLPAAATAGAGAWATFIKTGASGALTLEPNASETIDGQANNAEMDAAHDSVTVICDGTGWHIAAKKIS